MIGAELAPDDPQRLGRYWLASRLGSGGQGVVYEGYAEDGTRVAVKMLHPEAASQPKFRDRFRKEAMAAQQVVSFCTAKVLAVMPDAKRPYMVSEFIPGPSLREAVGASGPFVGGDLLRLATGLATALTAIHRAEVVHRDLKPTNVILGPDGPRVIDFGIARTLETPVTETGSVMGTFGYMPLEVLSGQRAEAAADVFAWGAVMLFAATGDEPFAGEHVGEVVSRALEYEPDLRVLPEPLRGLVCEALAKDPERRPSAGTLLMRLLDAHEPGDQQAVLAAGAKAAAQLHAPDGTVPVALALGDAIAAAYGALPPAVQEAAREVCLRLVVPGPAPDDSYDTVRTAGEDELLSGRPEGEEAAVRAAITALVDAGAMAREGEAVRLVSRAVLRAWPPLREWVRVDREGLRVHRRLGEAARTWEEHGRRPEDGYRGTALRSALDWAATAPNHLRPNLLERQFLGASRRADVKWARQRRWLMSGAAIVLVLASVAGLTAWQQSQVNEHQRNQAEARRLASVADNMRSTDPETARLLSVAAWRIAPVTEARAALISAMEQAEADTFTVPHEGGPRLGADPFLSADGRTLLTVGRDRIVRWDVPTHRKTGVFKGPGSIAPDGPGSQIGSPAYVTPDARILALESRSRRVQLWDVVNQKPLGGKIKTGMNMASFNPSGRIFIGHKGHRGSNGETVQLWDVKRHRLLFQRKYPHGGENIAVSPNGRYMAACSPGLGLELWDIKRNRRLPARWMPPKPERDDTYYCLRRPSVAFSPDSRRLSFLAEDGMYTWDIASGKEYPKLRHASMDQFAYSKDGDFIATASANDIRLWRLSSPAQPVFQHLLGSERPEGLTLDIGAGKIRYIRRDPTGLRVRSLDLGKAATPNWNKEAITGAQFSPGSRFLGVAKKVRQKVRFELREARSGRSVADIPDIPLPQLAVRGEIGEITSVDGIPSDAGNFTNFHGLMSFSRDGKIFAYSLFHTLREHQDKIFVWDTVKGHMVTSLTLKRTIHNVLGGLELSPDGKKLLVRRENLGEKGKVEIWDVHSKKKLKTLDVGRSEFPGEMAYRPDGRLFASAQGEKAHAIAMPSGKTDRKGLLQGQGTTRTVAFSPDGKYLAVGDTSGQVTLWDSNARRRLGVLTGTFTSTQLSSSEGVSALAFSSDSRTLAVGGEAGTLRLWDVESQQPIGSALRTPRDVVLSLAFDRNDTLHAAGIHVPHYQYTLAPEHMADAVCKRAGRSLSLTEWKTYIPQFPYREIC